MDNENKCCETAYSEPKISYIAKQCANLKREGKLYLNCVGISDELLNQLLNSDVEPGFCGCITKVTDYGNKIESELIFVSDRRGEINE